MATATQAKYITVFLHRSGTESRTVRNTNLQAAQEEAEGRLKAMSAQHGLPASQCGLSPNATVSGRVTELTYRIGLGDFRGYLKLTTEDDLSVPGAVWQAGKHWWDV